MIVRAAILFLPAALTPDGETCVSGLVELRVLLPAEVPRARRRASTAGARSCSSPSSRGRRSAARRSSLQVKSAWPRFWGPSGGAASCSHGDGTLPDFRGLFLGGLFPVITGTGCCPFCREALFGPWYPVSQGRDSREIFAGPFWPAFVSPRGGVLFFAAMVHCMRLLGELTVTGDLTPRWFC